MSFEIRVDGVPVHEVDVDPRLVTRVHLHSVAGEAGVAGSPFNGLGSDWVNLTVDVQQPTALPVVEDDARQAAEVNEVMTVNENNRRTAAIEEVNAEYAEKSAESGEDLSIEYSQAVADAMSPASNGDSEPAPAPKAAKAAKD